MPSRGVLGRNNETVHQGVAGKGQEGQLLERRWRFLVEKKEMRSVVQKILSKKETIKIAQYPDPKSRPDEQAVEILQQLEKEEELLQQKRRGKQAQTLAP